MVTDVSTSRVGQAPGDLVVVQSFVNTLDIELRTDQLGSPAGLRDWLVGSGLAGPDEVMVSAADLSRAVALREALRGVLSLHLPAAEKPESANLPAAEERETHHSTAAADLHKIAITLPIQIEVSEYGRVVPVPTGSGTTAALARILLIAAAADGIGTWARLKACSASGCWWAFYDRSPARNATWCSMRVCGSRAKSRSYRRRVATRPAD